MKKRNSKVFVAVTVMAFFLLFSMVAYAADPRGTIAEIEKRGKLRIAYNCASEHYQFRDVNNHPVGMAIDLGKMIAANLDVDMEITDMDWSGLIPALLTRKTDFLATTMSTTFSRAQRVLFTKEKWYVTGVSAWARKADGYQNWEQLNAKKANIGAVAGTVSAEVAKEYLSGAKLQTYQLDADVWGALHTKRIDAALNDNVFKRVLEERYPGFQLLTDPRELIKTDTWAFTIRPDDQFTWHYLNFFLEKAKENGQLSALGKYWTTGDQWKKDYLQKGPVSKEREELVHFLGIEDYSPYVGDKYRVKVK